MRTQCVKGQQHANSLRRNNYVNVTEMMCKLRNEQSAPEIDIDMFGGNPLEFHYFMVSTIEKHQTKVISICIVPVRVKSAAQEKDVLTYAMLDNYSQGSFNSRSTS